MQQPTKNEQARQSSRRGFFQVLAGALGFAFLGGNAKAAEAVARQSETAPTERARGAAPAVPASDKQPAPDGSARPAVWSPGPHWEPVAPTEPGGVWGWRNKKTGARMTDWIPRKNSEPLIRFDASDANNPTSLTCRIIRPHGASPLPSGRSDLQLVHFLLMRS